MKKNQLFQFSLTVICSMVLAACGSSGGSSNPTTQATNTTPAANTPTTTPATTPAANPTSEVANGANDGADKDATPLVAYEVDSRKYVGYKHVNKNISDLNINTSHSDGTADTPVGMNVQDPNKSFDTIVVAEPKNPQAGQAFKVGYLEDFDFRRNNVDNTALSSDGVAKFKTKVHLNASETTLKYDTSGNLLPFTPAANQPNVLERTDFGKGSKTKTDYTGNQDAEALVYKGTAAYAAYTAPVTTPAPGTPGSGAANDVTTVSEPNLVYNYTDTHFGSNSSVRPQVEINGSNVKYAKNTRTGEVKVTPIAGELQSRSQLAKVTGYANYADQENDKTTTTNTKKNVAEVYGYRTFAYENQYTGDVKDSKVNNLPLENKRLQNVQYGRVTTNLNGHSSFDEFRKGVNLGSGIETYVVDYGKFGDAGTEDHYFYRGINGITEKQLADLKTNTDNGILKYWGHAVAYGLNNQWDGNQVSAAAPTAIGATNSLKFVSGNHVHAWIDLSRNHVEGSIYNTWFQEGTKNANEGTLVPVDLVKFKGTLGANGNIAGESELTYKDSKGVFGASLYGANAEEMGGVVASNDKTPAGKWGAVFGAINTSASEIQNATNRGLSGGN